MLYKIWCANGDVVTNPPTSLIPEWTTGAQTPIFRLSSLPAGLVVDCLRKTHYTGFLVAENEFYSISGTQIN